MQEVPSRRARPFRLRSYAMTAGFAWTSIVGILVYVQLANERSQAIEIAKTSVRASSERDREWMSVYDHVYLPAANHPDMRESSQEFLVSRGGDTLVLASPALLAKEVNLREKGRTTRLTSLKPRRAENAPDPWEGEALRAVDRGASEVSNVEFVEGTPVLRFMTVLRTERHCLRCHAYQGYKEGDVRGGISIATPLTPVFAIVEDHKAQNLINYGILWGIGLAGLFVGVRRLNDRIRERDRAQDERLAAESLFRGVWEQSRDAMRLADETGKIIRVNPAYCALVGKKREELENRIVTVVFSPEYRDQMFAEYRHRFTGKIPSAYVELELPFWDGRHVSCERTDALVTTADGGTALVSIFRDLTERRRVADALQESEDRYRRIVGTTREGIWEIDAEAKTTYVNRPMAAMVGMTPDDMMGRSMFDFMDETWRVQAASNFARRKARVAEQHDFKLQRSDGSFVWTIMSTNPIVDRQGNFTGALAIVTDITDRKRSEEALSRSGERLRMITESTADVIAMHEPDGRFVYCNASAYNVKPDALVGKHLTEVLDERSAAEILGKIRQVASTGQSVGGEELIEWNNGKAWFHTLRSPVVDHDGRVTAVTSFSRNITELKQALDALHEAQERLKLETLRTRIAADLHDDIGSSLSSVSIFTEMLKQEVGPAAPKAHRMATRAGETLRQIQESLDDIVWTLNPENDTFENVVLRLREHAVELFEAAGLKFTLGIPSGPWQAQLPMQTRRQFYLIYKEALNNLVRHSGSGSAIVRLEIRDGILHLIVQDNGRGFDPEMVPGNGLRNMQRRAASIGGSVDILPEPWKGTTVIVRVPLA